MYLSSFYRLFLAFIYNHLIHKPISKYFIHLLLADLQNNAIDRPSWQLISSVSSGTITRPLLQMHSRVCWKMKILWTWLCLQEARLWGLTKLFSVPVVHTSSNFSEVNDFIWKRTEFVMTNLFYHQITERGHKVCMLSVIFSMYCIDCCRYLLDCIL